MYLNTVLCILVFALYMSGCSSAKRTGVLGSYGSLSPVSKGKLHFFQKSDDTNLTSYKKVIVPPIKVMSLVSEESPQLMKLSAEVSAYATAVYRKLIMKHSSNYELVDVGQKNTLIINIFISLIEVLPEGEGLDAISSISFKATQGENVHLLIEVRTVDAMNGKELARSMKVIEGEGIVSKSDTLCFKDLQKALDKWLDNAIVKH